MKKGFDYSKAKKVSIEVNGKTHSANYFLERGMLTVESHEYGRNSTQLGGLTEEGLARMLLSELVGNGS